MSSPSDGIHNTRELTPAEVAKINAETLKLNAEAEKLHSEAEAAQSLKIKTDAEGLKAAADAGVAQLLLASKQREERKELAKDEHYHVFDFSESVDSGTVERCIAALNTWSRSDPGCDLEIIFYSPGGNVLAGMKLFDFVLGLRSRGHRVTTRCMGYAASMAGILLQAGDIRIIGRESYVLIHEISALAVGKIGEIEDEVKFVRMIQDRVLAIFEDRAKPINPRSTKAFFKNKWERKDCWLSSDDCLKYGLVDKVE